MALISLLLLLTGFAVLAVWVDRRIEARQAAASALSTSETKSDQGWRTRFRQPSPSDTLPSFRTWAVTTFADQPKVQVWLAALPDEALGVFKEKLAAFCTDLGFELTWLVQNKLDGSTTLRSPLETVVMHYVDACYQATLIYEDVQVFQVWQDFMQNPYGKDQQTLALQLLPPLIEQALAPTAANSLLTMPEKERQIYLVQAIRESAEKQPLAFQAVLKAVLTTPARPTPPVEAILDQLKRPLLRRAERKAEPAVNGQPTATAP